MLPQCLYVIKVKVVNFLDSKIFGFIFLFYLQQSLYLILAAVEKLILNTCIQILNIVHTVLSSKKCQMGVVCISIQLRYPEA